MKEKVYYLAFDIKKMKNPAETGFTLEKVIVCFILKKASHGT